MGRSKVAGTHETAVEKGSGLHILVGLETECEHLGDGPESLEPRGTWGAGFRPDDIG
jgi:hypothetical protein